MLMHHLALFPLKLLVAIQFCKHISFKLKHNKLCAKAYDQSSGGRKEATLTMKHIRRFA